MTIRTDAAFELQQQRAASLGLLLVLGTEPNFPCIRIMSLLNSDAHLNYATSIAEAARRLDVFEGLHPLARSQFVLGIGLPGGCE